MAAFQYEIEYRRSAEHANADALSRPVSFSADDRLDVDEYLISYVNELPVTAQDIASATRKDPVLVRVYDSTLHRWPSVVADPVLQPYFSRKHELSVDQGCVLWGLLVVILEEYRVRLLDDLHQEDHGISVSDEVSGKRLVFAGPDWIRPLESVLVRVMFVR